LLARAGARAGHPGAACRKGDMRWRRVLLGGEGAIGGGLEVAAHGPSASARLTGQEASANRGAGEEQAAGAVIGEGADRRQSRRPLGPPPVPPLLSSSTSCMIFHCCCYQGCAGTRAQD
ncbi:Os01g0353900, partial [Oryza sativa Japonica Group]